MSITTNIDGSSGNSNQLLELLSVVSNPKVYEAKVKALQEATDENKKYVELVGPASEILALREKAKQDAEEAERLLSEAKSQASNAISQSKVQAKEIVEDAKAEAEQIKQHAEALADNAKEKLAAASLAETKVNASKVELEKALLTVEKMTAELNADKQATIDAAKALHEAREELIAKHKAFIESL